MINDEIRTLAISVRDPSCNRRLKSVQKRHAKLTQPVASLDIPNKLFLFWRRKLSSPHCSGCNSIFKCTALVNSSLPQGTTLANTAALEHRLQTTISNFVNKVKKNKGSRETLENGVNQFLVYQEEVVCFSLAIAESDTTAESTAASTREEAATIELFGKLIS